MQVTNIIQIKKFSALLGAILFGLSGAVLADDKTEMLIDKTVAVYGGDKLLGVKTLTVEEKYKGFRFGQSESPNEVDLVDYHSSVSIDFANQRKSFRWRRGSKKYFSTMHQLFDGKKGYSIDHSARTTAENSNITFASADRRHLLYVDTALVLLMNNVREQAGYVGEESFRGTIHDKVKFKAEGYPEMTLYIDRETGLVSKMQRPHWRPGQFYNYNFSEFEQKEGIQYATSTYVTRNGQPYNVSVSRKIEINPAISTLFALPEGYGDEAPSIDFSEMSVKKIADNTYLAGKNWGFSIFVDAGSYFIAAGGYEGLTERFKAMKEFTGTDKPLKYQVVSHHHLDHLGGMKEAAELGVTFITVKEHVESIRRIAETDLPEERFITVDKIGSFAGGALKVIDYPNGHSTHNLMSYFPASKIFFSADFYFSRQENGAPDGYEGLNKFKTMLKEQGIDVEYFAAAHSGRVLTAANFETSLNQISESVCPADWTICQSD